MKKVFEIAESQLQMEPHKRVVPNWMTISSMCVSGEEMYKKFGGHVFFTVYKTQMGETCVVQIVKKLKRQELLKIHEYPEDLEVFY